MAGIVSRKTRAATAAPAKRSTRYAGAGSTPFTVAEIHRIHAKWPEGGWMTGKLAENISEIAKEKGVAFGDVWAKSVNAEGIELPARPLICEFTPFRTISHPSLQKEDKSSNIVKGVDLATHLDYKEPFADEKALKEEMGQLADAEVNEKFPTATEEEFNAKAEIQEALFTNEYKCKLAMLVISREYERWMANEGQETMSWEQEDTHRIATPIQWDRKLTEDEKKAVKPAARGEEKKALVKVPAKGAKAKSASKIPLEKPIIRFQMRADKKSDALWCQIYERVRVPGKPSAAAKATLADEKGVKHPITVRNIVEYLRPGSVITPKIQFTITFSSKGAYMHATVKEVHVMRAKPFAGAATIDAKTLELTDGYGDEYEVDDPTIKEPVKDLVPAKAVAGPAPAKSATLARINDALEDGENPDE